jgi:hypothetical protein
MGNAVSQKMLPQSLRLQRNMTIEKIMGQLHEKTRRCPHPSIFDFSLFQSLLLLPKNGWCLKAPKTKIPVAGFNKSVPIVLDENILNEPTWLTASLGDYTWLIEFVAQRLEDIVYAISSARKADPPFRPVFLWHWDGCLSDNKHWSDMYDSGNVTKITLQCLIVDKQLVLVMSKEPKHKLNLCTHNSDYLLFLMQNRERLEYLM